MKHVDVLKEQFNVSLNLPGSKSITLRDAVLASLAQGQSMLEFPADCDDFSRISEALIELGVTIRQSQPESVSSAVTGGLFRPGPVLLNAGLSGTAARFLIALALLRRDETTIDGLPPLRARPNQAPGRSPCRSRSVGPFNERWTLASLDSRSGSLQDVDSGQR